MGRRYTRINPPLPNVGSYNVFSCIVQGTCDNEEWINDYAVMGADALTAGSEAAIANSFYAMVATALRAMMDTSTYIMSVKVTCLTTITRVPYVAALNSGAGFAGTASTPHLPKEMAAILSCYTAYKGQHGRGRKYTAGVPTSFVTSSSNANSLNTSGVAALTALGTAVLAGTCVDGATVMSPCIYTRVKGATPVTNAAPITSTIARSLLGTVRRRRPGRGK
jgi:hypothetical protein